MLIVGTCVMLCFIEREIGWYRVMVATIIVLGERCYDRYYYYSKITIDFKCSKGFHGRSSAKYLAYNFSAILITKLIYVSSFRRMFSLFKKCGTTQGRLSYWSEIQRIFLQNVFWGICIFFIYMRGEHFKSHNKTVLIEN